MSGNKISITIQVPAASQQEADRKGRYIQNIVDKCDNEILVLLNELANNPKSGDKLKFAWNSPFLKKQIFG